MQDFLNTQQMVNFYGFSPNFPANLAFAVIWGVIIGIQLILTIRTKERAFGVSMIIRCVLELVGFIGRVKLHANSGDFGNYYMACIGVHICPIFFMAAFYDCFVALVTIYGENYSLPFMRPAIRYRKVFLWMDIVAFALQTTGGILVTLFIYPGLKVMLAGLSLQAFNILIFILTITTFFARVNSKRDEIDEQYQDIRKSTIFRGVLYSMFISVVLLYIRCFYRLAVVAGPWGNSAMKNEVLFLVLDAGCCTVVGILLTVFSPGIILMKIRKHGMIDESKYEDPEEHALENRNTNLSSRETL
ncbi:unnamed protein product [Ambrosiozyma monospora]|uniref:Sphingoid long-chain base transporter RSB1 n=1 Tax=Ambrosiozyma monospora TaxID=43982 RepID=A0A9W7DEP0_AMBMO|nr:unnamed protein product [Ambrosiozyma monospora]